MQRCGVVAFVPYVPTGASMSFTMYSTAWCGYCHRLKRVLERDGITFAEVDIDSDPAAAELVRSVNGGNATVPTLVFADGSALTNPTPDEVRAKLPGS
jgi:mycoredoxin